MEAQYTPVESIPGLVAGLRRTWKSGKTLPLEWRMQQLRQLAKLLKENENKIISALKADLRSTDLITRAEIDGTLKELNAAIENLPVWIKPEDKPVPLTTLPGSGYVVKEPYGLVLIIAPWNYPFSLLLKPLIGAIAAGNVVCVKPSEVSSNCSRAMGELLPRYLDHDAVVVVEGAVEETQALLREAWDYIFYTGNGKVGREIMKAAAVNLTPVTLELGGKSPVILDSHANLDVAARRLCWAKFTINAGQTCVAPDYILVTRDMEKPLLEKMAATLKEFYADGPKNTRDYSRIINERHTQRVASLLEGHDVYVGGDVDVEDRYIAPTILTNVDVNSKLMQEEIFGPVLPVIPVDSVESAIDFINERPKPLALYIFSNSTATQDKVLSNTFSGGVGINEAIMQVVCPELPFGGVGESGMGAYNGKHTFDTFTHRKSVLKRATWSDPSLRYPPYTDSKLKWLKILSSDLRFPRWGWAILALVAVPILAYVYSRYGFLLSAASSSNARL
jgi:aldehyde dehydrogenase (NAD+)